MKQRHLYFIIFIILLLIGLNTYDIYKEVKFKEENKIKNIGSTLSERLLNINKVINKGSGLYKENNKYIYKGIPNNYIKLNNELWYIVSLEQDGTVKIVKTDTIKVSKNPLKYLNKQYYNKLDKNKIQYHEFEITSSDVSKLTNIDDINNLKTTKNKHYIGMLDVKEIALASKDVYYDEYLNTYFWVNKAYNYLYLSTTWQTNNNVIVNYDFLSQNKTTKNIRPALYLKKDLYLDSGKGTKNNPYVLKE